MISLLCVYRMVIEMEIEMTTTTMHFIIGDFAEETSVVLEEFESRDEALRWAADYCRHDLGGYQNVCVVAEYTRTFDDEEKVETDVIEVFE